MTPTSRILVTMMFALSGALAQAAPQESAPAGYAEARKQYLAGVAGNAAARDAAIAAFHALAAGNPGHPLLSAWEGAAITLQGRDASAPWDKMKFAEQGANLIEKALGQLGAAHDTALFGGTPESVETRLVAANTLLALPEFMNRRAGGKRALDAALASPAFNGAPPGARVAVLDAAARQAGRDKRVADEAALLKQIKLAAPQSPEAQRAATRLVELGQ